MTTTNALLQLRATRKAARFRQLLPTIESKLKEGVSHQQIIAALAELGLELTTHTYFNYLRRARKASPIARGRQAPQIDIAPPAAPVERPRTFDYDPRGNPDLLK